MTTPAQAAREAVLRKMHKPMSMVLDRESHQRENATLLDAYRDALLDAVAGAVETSAREAVDDIEPTTQYREGRRDGVALFTATVLATITRFKETDR